MINKIALLMIALLFGSVGFAADYPSLWDSRDAQLQKSLEQLVARKGLSKQVKNQSLALAVVDISNPLHPRMAALNGDRMLYAASLPKIAILLGAFVQIERGVLLPDAKLWSDMHRMIRHSDNVAATRVLERAGRKEVLEILQSPPYRLYDQQHNGGLWVGKAYAKAGAYQRDPLHNLSHGASVLQAARFYYLLDTNRLVNPELTRRMKEILVAPAIAHKFVKGLQGVENAVLYRKSGTWRDYHADSALVEFGEHRYIIVGLAKSRKGGSWLAELALPLHNLVVNPG